MPNPYSSLLDVVLEAISKASSYNPGEEFTIPQLFDYKLPGGVTEWKQIQTDFHNKGSVISRMFANRSGSLIQPLHSPRKKSHGCVVFTRK